VIHVWRPKTEPRALAKQRRAGLRRAFAALNAYGAGSNELDETLVRYDGGKMVLFLAQHRKCVFCGRRVGFDGSPVDHMRPKGAAWRHLPGTSPSIIDIGYWWLTWTWENQLFACTPCNSAYKRSCFPLDAGSPVLAGPVAPYRNKRLRPSHLVGTAKPFPPVKLHDEPRGGADRREGPSPPQSGSLVPGLDGEALDRRRGALSLLAGRSLDPGASDR
jgi:hypothetical protein